MLHLDVEAIMLRFLETEKKYLAQEKEEYSNAMVAVFPAESKHYIRFPEFDDFDSKIEAYRKIVEEAKTQNAVLIITVNNAFTRINPTSEEMENYEWGQLNATNASHCILLTASGPLLPSFSLQLGYSFRAGELILNSEPERTPGIDLHLLPNWPGTPIPSVN